MLLSKWLGDIGADDMSSMVGSESMTSSDWMLLALSSIGTDSKKQVGEAFVQRLLEKGDVHPAVAILLGLGEYNDAIEVYVAQQYWLEAILLTCMTRPAGMSLKHTLLRKSFGNFPLTIVRSRSLRFLRAAASLVVILA